MSIRVADITQYKSLKKFNLLAGESGLNAEITSVCLADLEVDNNLVPYANGFRRGSFIITSLRDADTKKDLDMVEVIESLIAFKCSGMAFNSRMLKELPKKALELCNKEGFPIFSFDPGEVYIEIAVFDIMQAIKASSVSFSLDREIAQMLSGSMLREEIEKMAKSINPDFLKKCTVSYLWSKEEQTDFSAGRIARAYSDSPIETGVVSALMAYKEGILVVVSMDNYDMELRDETIDRILNYIDNKENINIVSSSIHSTFTELDMAFRECNATYIVANIEGKQRLEYENIGIYKLLIPNKHQPEYISFKNRYLKEMNKEQLETAIGFVLSDGDYDASATKLICHRNTVRYRIAKIHEKTDPEATEYQFLENLSTAIKLHLIESIH